MFLTWTIGGQKSEPLHQASVKTSCDKVRDAIKTFVFFERDLWIISFQKWCKKFNQRVKIINPSENNANYI